MRLLLDTSTVILLLTAPRALSQRVRDLLADAASSVHFSAVNIWEIEIKRAAGRLSLDVDVLAELRAAGGRELAITSGHAIRGARLPRHHGDPFDRMLVAQAQAEGLTLVTSDRQIARYDVEILAAA